MIKSIKLHADQYDVWDDNHRFKVICAGRRWGKSILALVSALDVMAKKPNSIVAIVAPTYQQGKDIYWRDPLKLNSLLPADAVAKKNDSELFLQLKNGSFLYIRGSDRPDTLRGLRFDYVVLDEFAQMKSNVWEEIIQPTLLDSQGKAMFISTPYGYDKFYKLWKRGQKEDKEWKSWRFTSYENPYNSAEDLDKWRKDTDEDTFAQEYLAEFKSIKGKVYKEFDRAIHIIEPKELPHSWSFYRAIDFGYVNPTAVLYAAIDNEGVIYIFDEIYLSGLKTPDLAELLGQRSLGRSYLNTIADSASVSDIEELRKYGIAITGVSKTSSSGVGQRNEDWVTFKIRKVSEKLKARKLFVFFTCVNLIYEFENYKYIEVKDNERVKEIPLKKDDHALDALSYLIVSLPERVDPVYADYSIEDLPVDKDDWSFK